MKNLKIGLLIIASVFWLVGASSCKPASPPITAPATPSGLSATIADSKVGLSWAANTEANLKGYNIYWGTNSSQLAQSKFVAKTQTTTTITGLTNKTKYFFAIEAENDSDKKSAKSAQVSATPIDTSFKPGDTETYAPGRSGEIKTFTIKGREISYEVIDGLAIYQGDMILGKADEVAKKLNNLSMGISTQGVTCDGSDYVFFFSRCNKWSNGVVRYSIQNDWGSTDNNREMQSRITRAIVHWQQNTNLRFVASSSGDRLVFKNSSGCSSHVGRIGSAFDDTQDVNLNMGCGVGSIIHEIGHAIGIFHEQSREDRGSFVRINTGNIESGKGHNFDRHVGDARDIGAYDFGSIMHYGCWAFSTGDRDTAAARTIVPIDGRSCDGIGQRSGLSEGDILSAYSLYLPNFSFSGRAAGSSIPRHTAFDLSLNFDIEAVKDEYIIWTRSGTSGTVATGRTARFVPLDWSLGEQTITASIVIKGVTILSETISFNITNVAPVVDIIQPGSSGLEFCKNDPVTFKATAVDVDKSPNHNLPNSAIAWRINSGSTFATGATITKSFPLTNIYTVHVTATDADGASHSDSINLSIVNCTSTPPNAFITSPIDTPGSGPDIDVWPNTHDANGYYHQITLTGGATDLEDGTLTGASLVWKTNQAAVQPGGPSSGDQQLGIGNSITVKLYAACGFADHLVTLTATDSDGLISFITRLIRVNVLC